MRIEILGCSGSVMQGYNTTSILINGEILIDVGSAVSVLSENACSEIRTVLITHSHIDHIKELPFLIDGLYSRKKKGGQVGIRVLGSDSTINSLNDHIFNGLIWPDIYELDNESPFLSLERLPQDWFDLDGIQVKAFRVDHIEGSVGYVLREGGGYVIFTGDTGYNQELFDLIRFFGPELKACFVESSFPNRMDKIASVSHHLTPNLIMKGLDGVLSSSTRVIVYHIKPKYMDEVITELPEGYEYIRGGEVINI
jgi:ribonuclease BN (tRNA processing enzyme)